MALSNVHAPVSSQILTVKATIFHATIGAAWLVYDVRLRCSMVDFHEKKVSRIQKNYVSRILFAVQFSIFIFQFHSF